MSTFEPGNVILFFIFNYLEWVKIADSNNKAIDSLICCINFMNR
jgi:hypothetical protein